MLLRILAHRYFFIFILVVFFLQMAWIALSAVYPMLFDEEFHLGIIEIYSRQLSPFIASQPPEAAFHGDITRYGSYLFHYLMSFPYWLLAHLGADLKTIVIALRFLCIFIVLGGVVMWRYALLRFGVSKALAHTAIAIFTLIPLVPFALAQVNYDALAFLLVPVLFYLALRTSEKNPSQSVWLLFLLATSAIAGIVKFTLLPIAFGCVLFVGIRIFHIHGKKTKRALIRSLQTSSRTAVVAGSILLVLAGGLFVERYGVNLLTYHAIEPKCDKLHSTEDCSQYTVWRRDTSWKAQNEAINKPRDNPIVYTGGYWAPHIFNDFFVTAAFVYDEPRPLEIRYLPTTMQASSGNPVLRYGGWAMAGLAVVALALSARFLRRHYATFSGLVLLTIGIYSVSLWLRNYSDYLSIGTPTAAQGRYYIAFLIPVLVVVGLAFSHILRRYRYKTTLLLISVLLLTQGGGVANYILYSNSKWYWSDNRKTITTINTSTKKILRQFIPL